MNSTPPRAVPHSQTRDAPTTALPQEYFVSQQWHRRDLDIVFKRRWLFVGHGSQIPQVGDFFTYEIENESILIVRSSEVRISGFYNTCRHRGARICTETSGHAKGFMCPYHQWTYGLDGRLQTARLMKDIDKSQFAAIPVWVEEWNGMLFINLAPERPARTVAEHLKNTDFSAFALDRTRVVLDRTYAIASNWKLAAETFAECYHCGHVHPELRALVDPLKDLEAWDDAAADDDYVIFTGDMTSAIVKDGTRSFTMTGDIECAKPLGNGRDWRRELTALSWFPQFGMFVFPDHAVTYSWKPVSPTTCVFRSTWLVHEDAVAGTDYQVEKLSEFAELLNQQDKRICEVAQLGIQSSGYRPGPYHPIFEGPVRGFNRVYLNQVGRDPTRAGVPMDLLKPAPAPTEAPAQPEVRAWTLHLDSSEDELVKALKPAMPIGRRLRPKTWPGNKRAAIAITFDVDNEFPMSAALPSQIAAGSYGWFEALPRLHRLLDREQVPATFYIPVGSALIGQGIVRDIKAAGRHEIGLHGWTHERVPELKGRDDERRLLEQQIGWYQREVGGFPRGYRAPNGAISLDTIDLLLELGVKYDSSIPGGDDCFELLSKGRETGMIEVPFSWILTDWMYLHTDEFYQGNLQSPDEVYRVFRSEFDAARAEGGLFMLTLHPHVIGRRSRISILERVIQDAKAAGDVWFATVEQIVDHIAAQNGLPQKHARPVE